MRFVFIISLILLQSGCQAQPKSETDGKLVGGPCEGCEAVYEYGDQKLSSSVTLPGYDENEPKLKISGTIYKKDGVIPASGVILYIYHTDRNGIYLKKGDEKGWARRHGYIRGWLKTGADGKYVINTFRPASYPGTSIPEHIHLTVKESDKNEYYIDDILFVDDPSLTPHEKEKLNNRAGSGITHPKNVGGIFHIKRDIILGLNIPNYE